MWQAVDLLGTFNFDLLGQSIGHLQRASSAPQFSHHRVGHPRLDHWSLGIAHRTTVGLAAFCP